MTSDDMIDLYSDYLITQSQQATATGLSVMMDGLISHDQVTRFLNGKPHLLLPTIKSRCQLIRQEGLPHAHFEQLAAQLVFPQPLIASLAAFKDTSLTDLIETQMRILYDAVALKSQLPHASLHFPDLYAQISEQTKSKTLMDLHHRYDFLIEKKQLLQKQVALNPELMLAQLLLSQ